MVKFTEIPEDTKESAIDGSPGSMQDGHSTPNGRSKRKSEDAEGQLSKKRKKKHSSHANGRRASVSKPARDPRDNPSPPGPPSEIAETRSPSPVIDFDGLSRPSKQFCPFRARNTD